MSSTFFSNRNQKSCLCKMLCNAIGLKCRNIQYLLDIYILDVPFFFQSRFQGNILIRFLLCRINTGMFHNLIYASAFLRQFHNTFTNQILYVL